MAALYFAAGMGLFIGMMIARRVGTYLELRGQTAGFIGWALVAQGFLFAGIGLMPTLVLASAMLFLSRVVLGVEFAIQETLLNAPGARQSAWPSVDYGSRQRTACLEPFNGYCRLVAARHYTADADSYFGVVIG